MTAPLPLRNDPIEAIRGGLVVSSQASSDTSLLADPDVLVLLARAAEQGGAVGFRVDGVAVLSKLRPLTDAPLIAIHKRRLPGADNYITTSPADALALVNAGADIVAAQATAGSRPGPKFSAIAEEVHQAGALVMADISTEDEAYEAREGGADLVATTMVGYTPQSSDAGRPAHDLIRTLAHRLGLPVVAEGGIWTRDDVRQSFDAGATAVVVGSAVTAPDLITAYLAAATPRGS